MFPFQFTLRNVLTPKSTPSSKVYLETYTNDNYWIDRNSEISFTTECTPPCKRCLSPSYSSSCESCYTDGSLVDGYVLWHSIDKKCLK